MSKCSCSRTSWHNLCECGCSEDDTACRAAGCCGVEYPPHLNREREEIRMPPRARKTAAKKPPPEETTPVTNESTESTDTETDETPAPKRRGGGRKRSELAHAARAYEQADDAVHRLEARYQKVAVTLSEIGAKLAEARRIRDESWAVIEEARNSRTPEPSEESTAEEEGSSEE